MKKFFLLLLSVSIFASASFIRDNSKEVVIDSDTKLMWQDNSEAKTKVLNWIDAVNYCESLTLAGYSDWRLPNIIELKSITDLSKSSNAIDDAFVNILYGTNTYYWSSSTVNSSPFYAWVIYFLSGEDWWGDKDSESLRVRCVRNSY